MSATSTIPTESLSGCIIRQLYHGTPYLVFVEHPPKPWRAVFLVAHNGPGGYKPKGPRLQWQDDGDNDDAAIIAAEYLQRTIPT